MVPRLRIQPTSCHSCHLQCRWGKVTLACHKRWLEGSTVHIYFNRCHSYQHFSHTTCIFYLQYTFQSMVGTTWLVMYWYAIKPSQTKLSTSSTLSFPFNLCLKWLSFSGCMYFPLGKSTSVKWRSLTLWPSHQQFLNVDTGPSQKTLLFDRESVENAGHTGQQIICLQCLQLEGQG